MIYVDTIQRFNIGGNKNDDKAAKLAHFSENPLTSPDFSYKDIKKIVTKDTHEQWKNIWVKLSTKLYEIKKTTYR